MAESAKRQVNELISDIQRNLPEMLVHSAIRELLTTKAYSELVQYYLCRCANPTQLPQAIALIQSTAQLPAILNTDNKRISQDDLTNKSRADYSPPEFKYDDVKSKDELATKALAIAIEQELYDLVADILQESKPSLNAASLFLLIQRNEYRVLKSLLLSEVRVTGLKVRRDGSVLAKVRMLIAQSHKGPRTLRLGDLVKAAVKQVVDVAQVLELCIECSELKDSSDLEALLKLRREEDALRVVAYRVDVSAKSLAIALEHGCLRYAVACVHRGIVTARSHLRVFEALYKSIKEAKSHLEMYLYIIRKSVHKADLEDAGRYIEIMQEIVSPEQVAEYLNKVFNPLKLIVLLIELALEFQRRFGSMRLRLERVVKQLMRLGLSVQEQMATYQKMKAALFDRDIEGRDVLAIITEHNLLDFLGNALIENISHDIWFGPYVFSGNPIASTSWLWRLVYIDPCESSDLELALRHRLTARSLSAMPAHGFQFAVWKTAAGFRVTLVAFEYFGLTLALFAAELVLRQKLTDISHLQSQLHTQRSSLTSVERAEYCREAELARDGALAWDVTAIIILITLFKGLLVPLFKKLTRRPGHTFSLELMLDLVVAGGLLSLYLVLREESLGIADVGKPCSELLNKLERVQTHVPTSLLVSMVIFCLGVRAACMLRITQVLGPFIRILESMVGKIFEFALFYFVLLFVFALCATLLFPSTDPEFQRADIIMLTLFQSSVGVFDLNPPGKYQAETEVYYVLFIFVANIMLLNLIVAILNDIYANMSRKSVLMYHKELILLRHLYHPHPTYQFLVSSYLSFDILLSFLLLPFFPWLRQRTREQINKVLLYVEYILAFLPVFCIYLLTEVLLLPVAYILTCYHKFRLLVTRKKRCWPSLWALLSFVVVGLPILLVYLATDVYYCVKHAIAHEPQLQVDQVTGTEDHIEEDVLKEWSGLMEKTASPEVDCETLNEMFETAYRTVLGGFSSAPIKASTGIPQLPLISRLIRQLLTSQYVNITSLHNLLDEFLQQRQMRRFLKRLQTTTLKRKGAAMTPKTQTQTQTEPGLMLISSKSQPTEKAEGEESGSPKKMCKIAMFHQYDRQATQRAIRLFCASDISVADVVADIQRFTASLPHLVAATLRGEGVPLSRLNSVRELEKSHPPST